MKKPLMKSFGLRLQTKRGRITVRIHRRAFLRRREVSRSIQKGRTSVRLHKRALEHAWSVLKKNRRLRALAKLQEALSSAKAWTIDDMAAWSGKSWDWWRDVLKGKTVHGVSVARPSPIYRGAKGRGLASLYASADVIAWWKAYQASQELKKIRKAAMNQNSTRKTGNGKSGGVKKRWPRRVAFYLRDWT